MPRIFLLSPASSAGARAGQLLNPRAQFPLALALRSPEGAPLGEVFSFLSALYFRGKITYARAFARPPHAVAEALGGGALVITPSLGLQAADYRVRIDDLVAFSRVPIDPRDARYRVPLHNSAELVRRAVGSRCDVVLLGSIASGKYVDVLLDVFGSRLLFPPSFVGRGDMSRGGLLLRQTRAGKELEYVRVEGAVRHGPRPPKLPRKY